MSFQSVTVLTPHGRRQIIKVTPNFTILQILEEVCKKYEFPPEKYDLTHHRRTLDLSSMFRFSGLPNNATLEMEESKIVRKETNVIICLQLEDGTRLKGCFKPATTLLDLILELSPQSNQPNTVIIYMRTEVFGTALSETSIKSLGLTSGSAILRLVHRNPEDLKCQANVSAVLPLRSSDENKAGPHALGSKNVASIVASNATEAMDEDGGLELPGPSTMASTNVLPISEKNATMKDKEKAASDKIYSSSNNDDATEFDPNIIELGERHAILFSLDAVDNISLDLPDSFFELNVDDIKKILRELRKEREGMENAPLLTAKLRELEESKTVLNRLGKYKNTVIRIQFPDRYVLQGTFLATETIEHVMNFVRDYLTDREQLFDLFVTPPKTILLPEAFLIEVNCVPQALIHFSPTNSNTSGFIRDEYLTKLTSPTSALLAAALYRGFKNAPATATESNTTGKSGESSSAGTSNVAGGSGIQKPNHEQFLASSVDVKDKKMPKWFKPLK